MVRTFCQLKDTTYDQIEQELLSHVMLSEMKDATKQDNLTK